MKTIKTNVAIIGAGSAGLNARREVVKAGKDWVMIDGGPLGTTCARVGCMPSKLLIAAADAAHEVAHAGAFGVEVDEGGWRVNAPAVFDRVRRERDRFYGFVVEAIDELDQERVLRDWARFVDTTTLLVGDHTRVEADSVILATGSSPFIPPNFEPIRDKVMVNDDVFMLDEVPEKLAVIGAGVIGLELGQALARLGSEVHVLDLFPRVGFFTDPEVNEVARQVLGEEMSLHLETKPGRTEALEDGRVLIGWSDPDGTEHEEVFTHVLVAAGRRPNLTGFGLEDLDLPRDERGAIVSDPSTMQIGDLPLFLAGDASGHRPLLHEASDEGRIAGYNAARFPEVFSATRRTPLGVAFTNPQMGTFGSRLGDLNPDDIEIGKVSYFNQGRARVMLKNKGIVRLYADKKTCKLVGGEMFGPGVEHTAHLLAWVTQQGMRVPDILRLPFYHPVVEEGIRTALRDLAQKLEVTGECPPQDFALAIGS